MQSASNGGSTLLLRRFGNMLDGFGGSNYSCVSLSGNLHNYKATIKELVAAEHPISTASANNPSL